MIARTTHPVHFEDFDGHEFERLVFAYHLRAGWTELAWLGQTGSDQGRDIIGNEIFDDRLPRTTIIQCVNRGALTQAKAEQDMAAAVAAMGSPPEGFKFVCRSSVSAERRTAVEAAGKHLGLSHVRIWSGTEFEEELRLRAEFLLHRFVEGVVFPDAESELRAFADDFPNLTDTEALGLMAATFERPAFWTPFQTESSLPAFQRAIEDTIGALNTGIWKTRDGVEIRRIPSLHSIRDPSIRSKLGQVVRELDEVRRVFKAHLQDGGIRHCECGDASCPVFMVRPQAVCELDRARRRALETFRGVYPPFGVHVA